MATMSDFDITQLNLADPEQVPQDEYVAPYNDNSTPIDAGTYSGKLVDGQFKNGNEKTSVRFGAVTSKKNGKNYLSVEISAEFSDTKTAGKNSGSRRVYGKFNTIPESLIFNEVKPGRENANGFMDLLIAAGWTSSLRTNDDYMNAIMTLVEKGAQIRGRVDWQAFSNPKSTEYAGTGETFRGMKNFPLNTDGTHNPRITDSGGNTLLAKNEIRAVYPPKKG